ncbi:zinc finger matrin-type protein 1 isoform X1 [Sparus aurata]|uniref:zinc finger matrin-type protein 1 isoform X1 n=1 Tax=Sparus aurata TaxID=8175 RepID=UPI0011C1A82C|nr:zinc finger matrin-type protein 1-like isoform X1 [Sparus aurata]
MLGKKMDDRSVCTPLLAESDAQHNTTSTPHAASVPDADKVINTKIDSTQVEGDESEEELLKGLLTDDYCHVCEAVLLFESQRLSHYEGKKHAQKLRVYLQARRAEKMDGESTGPQRTMMTDRDRFCELCNMVFSSPVVAKSHYEGKVHFKNLRKQGLQPPGKFVGSTEVHNSPSLSQDPDTIEQKSAPEGAMDPTGTTTAPSTEVDLNDPNKYCALCAASFNNPQMAVQHYNGRKHQRNQTRQDLLKELGDDAQQANSLMCQMCSLQFNSVEMYQAHMQGNKHQIREKKVINLCKTQQKAYNTFADELSDYIQIQKARGIAPKSGQVLPPGEAQKEDKEDDEEEEVINKADIIELNKPVSNFPPASNPHHHSHLGCYNPVERWRPPYQAPPWPPHGFDYSCPPPVLPGSVSPVFTNQPIKRRRGRKQSSSSSYTATSSNSSSYSSYSSSTSDNDDTEYRRREKRRRIRRSRRERDKRTRDEDIDKEEKRRKRWRGERDKESDERRRRESGESEEERRRKKQKNHGKKRRRDKKSKEQDLEAVGGETVMDKVMPEDTMDNRKETEVNLEQRGGGQDGPAKPKYRKEKKKTKERADTRTEEEKLWDDSILGC